MYEDDRTVDELIELAEEAESFGLAKGMEEIRGVARGKGVALAVDLHGMLYRQDGRSLMLGVQLAPIANCPLEVGDFSDIVVAAGDVLERRAHPPVDFGGLGAFTPGRFRHDRLPFRVWFSALRRWWM